MRYLLTTLLIAFAAIVAQPGYAWGMWGPRGGPVGPVEVKEKPSVVLKVTLEEGEWKEVATALSLKLLKLKGVSGATIGEKGNITLEHDGTGPDEQEVKKLVKEAGMKFLSMVDPKKEPEPKKDLD